VTWAPIDPDATWAVLVWDDDLLVTMAAVTERDVLVGELRTHVACIRGMRTRPDHRRRGFASSAMNRAMQFVWKELRPEMALLLSSEMAVPFYEGLGCRILPGHGAVRTAEREGGVLRPASICSCHGLDFTGRQGPGGRRRPLRSSLLTEAFRPTN
jgi:GNAT superfamily N-acetyltransferase